MYLEPTLGVQYHQYLESLAFKPPCFITLFHPVEQIRTSPNKFTTVHDMSLIPFRRSKFTAGTAAAASDLNITH